MATHKLPAQVFIWKYAYSFKIHTQ